MFKCLALKALKFLASYNRFSRYILDNCEDDLFLMVVSGFTWLRVVRGGFD